MSTLPRRLKRAISSERKNDVRAATTPLRRKPIDPIQSCSTYSSTFKRIVWMINDVLGLIRMLAAPAWHVESTRF
ncbi:uncharacterized protein [Oscarella lobularis]|uniref:uncharacterized protein isoform X2 n=1 Tax=Oscarella lobularis TaxID=121494 RepID=UPI0033133198